MSCIIFVLPGSEHLRETVAMHNHAELGAAEVRRFPDGEAYVRINSDVRGRHVLLLCSFHQPDSRFLTLYFMACQVRAMGASRVSLLAPYLPYLRQDKAFHPGEAVTSVHFAQLLSQTVDELVTIDPHLHRYASLGEIYKIRTVVRSSAPHVSAWVKKHVSDPVIIGPDAESAQWVSELAAGTGAPFLILEKTRRGDRNVEVSVPQLQQYKGRNVILVDDIVSTGRTMAETVRHVIELGFAAPVCISIHPLFAQGAESEMVRAGASELVSCNTIPHHTNRIDISDLLTTP